MQRTPIEPTWTSYPLQHGLVVEGPDFSGILRRQNGSYTGEFVVDSSGPLGLAFALRGVLAHVLIKRGMLLLHASGVIRDGQLWIFAGRPKVGKTTIAQELNDGGQPFSIDRVVLARDGSDMVAHPTPFSDYDSEVPRMPEQIPTAVIFVEQGPAHSLRAITPARATRNLFRHSLVSRRNPVEVQTALDTAAGMADRLPAFELSFSKDVGFWKLLEAERDLSRMAAGGGRIG